MENLQNLVERVYEAAEREKQRAAWLKRQKPVNATDWDIFLGNIDPDAVEE